MSVRCGTGSRDGPFGPETRKDEPLQSFTLRRCLGPAGLATVTCLAVAASAAAQKPYGYDGPPAYVIAESDWGKGTVRGAVRPGRKGVWQVQLPRGTWIDCERSCSETLRRATVDFWESSGPQAKDSGPGYFRWEFWRR